MTATVRRWPVQLALAGLVAALLAVRGPLRLVDVESLRFKGDHVAITPGLVVEVESTPWELAPKIAGLLPLTIHRVRFRFLDSTGTAVDAASYSHGLAHRIRDRVLIEHLRGEPSVARIRGTHRRPYGPEGLRLLAWPAGALLAVVLAWVVSRPSTRRGKSLRASLRMREMDGGEGHGDALGMREVPRALAWVLPVAAVAAAAATGLALVRGP